ncbi:MAG: hypothetical protein JKY00_01615 [Roseicyclus sp.]|nr:hypothetical protein [Roseicyclus sp.]
MCAMVLTGRVRAISTNANGAATGRALSLRRMGYRRWLMEFRPSWPVMTRKSRGMRVGLLGWR